MSKESDRFESTIKSFDALKYMGADPSILREKIISQEYKPIKTNASGETFLHYVAKNGKKLLNGEYMGELVLEGRPAAANELDKEGNTPLHAAVKHGNKVIYELLLKACPDLSILNNKGESAQEMAILKGWAEPPQQPSLDLPIGLDLPEEGQQVECVGKNFENLKY